MFGRRKRKMRAGVTQNMLDATGKPVCKHTSTCEYNGMGCPLGSGSCMGCEFHLYHFTDYDFRLLQRYVNDLEVKLCSRR